MSGYYIASCMFTAQFPEISMRMQNYIRSKSDIEIVRCCIPGYRVEHNTERIAGDDVRNAWKELPVSQVFQPEDRVISVCHNCTNIVEEWRGAKVLSLWEMIDQDPSFQFPDYGGMEVTVQDCWRTRERRSEQDAVRSLLTKMNIRYVEAEKHHGETDFCGSTLYREQPAKNYRLAPRHYVEEAEGKFVSHTLEEQTAIMEDYCRQFHTDMVVCYCHYCLEGLIQGKVNGRHIGELLFPDKI
ncbi:MAG TPA: hypothetical protein IAA17_05305 [Candidatus Lachnoclostridium stercorigallinarum]|uniref:Uncharacterized protein n=1 Tax=Candidatus Lachnoclostridium stercorigallinarum TaxID=2838634 RepID=A0A9D2GI76_9FIRM|nr:hypothetical protein [Candidatus Lachnoclostridium stercorigallinarum]